jgi:16S rRNA (cytosine967-C5)-methyltransferase
VDLAHAQARVRKDLPDTRDRALATEVVTGTLRWRARLDHIIQQASSRPLGRIDPDVLDLLRLSAYQLLHLERVPDHAVVDDAVGLVRSLGKSSASPFVNAVLRAVVRRRATLDLPQPPSSARQTSASRDEEHEDDEDRTEDEAALLDYLATTLSNPRWLAERWYRRYGFEATEQWLHFNNTAAPVALRVNTLRRTPDQLASELAAHGVDTARSRWTPDALIVTQGNPTTTPLANQGLFWLQDEASQLVAELVMAQPGQRVLDTCASPGGKALVVASTLDDEGLLVCGDLRPRRVAILKEILAGVGPDCTRIVRFDARRPPCGPVFDWVLLDAPCSGLGTLRRDPDIRWRRLPDDLESLAAMQLTLLEGAASAVAVGGHLVYATCSSEPEENQLVVSRFLETHPHFRLEPPSQPRLSALVDGEGFFQTLPHRDGLEAFFAATLGRSIS